MPRLHLAKLAERARTQPALPAAVAFPVDRDSLQLALSGAFAGYVAPTLFGPEQRIRDAAIRAGLDISRLPLVSCCRSSATRWTRASPRASLRGSWHPPA